MMMMDNQVRALRKRDTIDSFQSRTALIDFMRKHKIKADDALLRRISRKGTYWGTFTNIEDYGLKSSLSCPHESTLKLANLPTRLWTFPDETQERLINWGYAVCDAAMRRHIDPKLPNNAKFPYKGGVR
jgi:NTE family protein